MGNPDNLPWWGVLVFFVLVGLVVASVILLDGLSGPWRLVGWLGGTAVLIGIARVLAGREFWSRPNQVDRNVTNAIPLSEFGVAPAKGQAEDSADD